MTKTLTIAVALLSLAVSLACARAKAPAQAAVKAAESALQSLEAPDVAKYASEQAKAAQDAFAVAKGQLAKEDYKGALASAGPIPDKVREVLAAAAAKKDELTRAWQEVAAGLPAMLGRLELRLEALSPEKLPAGIDAEKVAAAKASIDAIEDAWAKAREEFAAGSIAEATARARDVAAKARELTTLLGTEPPVANTPTTPTK